MVIVHFYPAGKSGSKAQNTPNKTGGDRYIPNRSAMQMDVANFLLTKEDSSDDTPTKKVRRLYVWSSESKSF